MPELEIIGGSASNFVWTCRIACAEKGVPYKLTPVMPHTPEVDAIHPFGKIPVMRHGEVTLCESRAIITYIDRAFAGPPLAPADALEAARVEQWVSIVMTTVDPLWLRRYVAAHIFPGTPDRSPNRAVIDEALPRMASQFAVMDRAVAAGSLGGASLTLADMYFVPIVFYMGRYPESAALLARSGNLARYLDRQMLRKSVVESIPQAAPGQAGR